MDTILLIDDDIHLAELLCEYFLRYDLILLSESHPQKGIKTLTKNSDIALVILDVMLPDMDGFEVLKIIRKTNNIPVLMLTARGNVTDRVVGLEIGADDYLPKPFEPRELVARIHNIIKRSKKILGENVHENEWKYGGLIINKQMATLNKTALDLTAKELELLILFAKNYDKFLTRDEIMNALSGIEMNYFSRSIDILVSRLRHKIKPMDCIKTARGKGYKFMVQLRNDAIF